MNMHHTDKLRETIRETIREYALAPDATREGARSLVLAMMSGAAVAAGFISSNVAAVMEVMRESHNLSDTVWKESMTVSLRWRAAPEDTTDVWCVLLEDDPRATSDGQPPILIGDRNVVEHVVDIHNAAVGRC